MTSPAEAESGYSKTLDGFSAEQLDAFIAGRERWNALRMDSVLQILASRAGFSVAGRRVLEYGCGIGAGTRALASLGAEAKGADVFGRLIDKAKVLTAGADNPTFHPIEDELPFDDESFDLVVSLEVLEHVPISRRARFFSEFRRVLKKDGLGYLSYPNFWFPIEQHTKLPFHHWLQRIRPREGLVYEDIPSKYSVRRELRGRFSLTDITRDFLRSSYARQRFGLLVQSLARGLARTPFAPQDYLILRPKP